MERREHESQLPPDDLLVARLRDGDEGTFALLLDAWSGGMRRLAALYVSSRATAEEVVQDTWLAVVQNLHAFQARSSFKHWVYRILANTAKRVATKERRTVPSGHPHSDPTVDQARFRAADQIYPGHWREPPASWPSPEQEVLATEIRRLLAEAVERLPARQRAVITLRDVEGYSADEACSLLDISPANQRVLLHRARAAVRAELEKYLSPGA